MLANLASFAKKFVILADKYSLSVFLLVWNGKKQKTWLSVMVVELLGLSVRRLSVLKLYCPCLGLLLCYHFVMELSICRVIFLPMKILEDENLKKPKSWGLLIPLFVAFSLFSVLLCFLSDCFFLLALPFWLRMDCSIWFVIQNQQKHMYEKIQRRL